MYYLFISNSYYCSDNEARRPGLPTTVTSPASTLQMSPSPPSSPIQDTDSLPETPPQSSGEDDMDSYEEVEPDDSAVIHQPEDQAGGEGEELNKADSFCVIPKHLD